MYANYKEFLDKCEFNINWVNEPAVICGESIMLSNTNPESIATFNKSNIYGDITTGTSFLLDSHCEIEGDE